MTTTCLITLLLSPLGFAQQQQTTYVTDLNGKAVAGARLSTSTSGNTTTRTETTQSVNGRTIPLESMEERLISEDANGRVLERLVHRFDQDGKPAGSEKVQIQERKNADGSVSSTATAYQRDINGAYQVYLRTITESSKSGNATNANVSVERTNVNGSWDVVERKKLQTTQDAASQKSDTTTYRKDASGRFSEVLRVVTDSGQQNGAAVENSAQYELDANGKLRLASQTVSRVRKNADGSESQELDIFRAVPGRAEPTATPRLEERQIIERRKVGDQLIESTSVQRPTISDPNKLGAPRKIGDRVCTGANCK